MQQGWRNRNLSGRWERGWGPRGWRAKVKAGGPGLTRVCLQRARTDEATATGSRSEAEDEDDEDYVPYVPLRQRRQLLVRAVGREKNEGRRWGFSDAMGVAPGPRSEVSVRGSVVPRQTRNWQSHLRRGAALPPSTGPSPKSQDPDAGLRARCPTCVGLGSEGHWWNLSSRSCCSEDARELRKRSSRTAAASPEEMRTTSHWVLSPTSASWISTSISKRRLKVGWAAGRRLSVAHCFGVSLTPSASFVSPQGVCQREAAEGRGEDPGECGRRSRYGCSQGREEVN